MSPRRIAIVDMGSNSLKFSITEVNDSGGQTVIHERADTIRLSAGIRSTGAIEPGRMTRALESLKHYEQVARAHGVEQWIGVATAAIRMASNGQDLLDAIARTTSWNIRVISGDEEAELTFLGLQTRIAELRPRLHSRHWRWKLRGYRCPGPRVHGGGVDLHWIGHPLGYMLHQ